MRELQLKLRRVGAVKVIEMTGVLDAVAFTEFRATLMRVMEEVTPCIVLECSGVTYIGCAQLKELINLGHDARLRDGGLKYVGLPRVIRHMADLIAGDELMEFYDDMPQALEAFRRLSACGCT